MISPAALIADIVNPIFAICLLAAPLLPPRVPVGRFWGQCALGVGTAILIAEAGKGWQVWPGRPTFPSGHETFALAAATLLVLRDSRWAFVALPLVLVLAWALVAAHYHYPLDIAGACFVGPPTVLIAQRLLRGRRGREKS